MGWLVALSWLVAGIAAVVFLAWIGYNLFGKLGRLAKAAEPLIENLDKFAQATEIEVDYQRPNDNLSDDPLAHIQYRQELKRKSLKRAEDRQRRLVARLKQQTPGEQ